MILLYEKLEENMRLTKKRKLDISYNGNYWLVKFIENALFSFRELGIQKSKMVDPRWLPPK